MLKCAGLDTINSITYICRQSLKKRVENQESELPGSAGKTMWPSMDAMDMSGLLKKWGLFSYPLKRTKQETYFRKHSDVYFCCSYIRMTTPGSGLLSRWIIFFLTKWHVWLFIIIHVFLFILKIIASVTNQHNLYFASELQMAELKWTPTRYRAYICSWCAR